MSRQREALECLPVAVRPLEVAAALAKQGRERNPALERAVEAIAGLARLASPLVGHAAGDELDALRDDAPLLRQRPQRVEGRLGLAGIELRVGGAQLSRCGALRVGHGSLGVAGL